MGVSGGTAVAETPERPLLTDFPSPGVVSPLSQGPQHIYMEIPQDTGYENAHTLGGGGGSSNRYLGGGSVQPIHLPLLEEHGVTSGSNSSQSSGYYSEYRPPSSSRELKLQQQQQQQQLKPKLDLPTAVATTEQQQQGRPLTPGRQLEIQDSQFI